MKPSEKKAYGDSERNSERHADENPAGRDECVNEQTFPREKLIEANGDCMWGGNKRRVDDP
jgi:hypothetical protein